MKAMMAILRTFDPRAFFGPIFFKEMLVSGRGSFAHWSRFVVVGLLLGLLALVLQGILMNVRLSGGAQRIYAYSAIAPSITLAIGWLLAIILPLVAAAFGSGSMLSERRSRTLESILSTPMSAWTVVASKVASQLIQIVILALLTLPALLAARAFGGISIEIVVAFLTIALTQAVFATVAATWLSLRAEKAWSAMSGAVSAVAALSTLPWIPVFVLTVLSIGATGPPPALFLWASGIAYHLSPAAGLFAANTPEAQAFFSSAVGLPVWTPWVASSLWTLVLSWLMLWSAAVRLRRDTVGKRRQSVKKTMKAQAKARRRRRRGSRTVIGNPVAWRELRQPLWKGNRVYKILAALLCVGLLLFVYSQLEPTNSGMHYSILMLVFFVAVLQPLNATTSALSGEREGRTLDVLLSTPMSAWSIMLGKLAGAFPRPLIYLQFITVHVIIFALVGEFIGVDTVSMLLIPHAMLLGVGTAALLGSAGLFFGTILKKNSVAMAANILLWVGVWLGLLLVFAILGVDIDSPAGTVAAFINPFILIGTALYGGIAIDSWGSQPASISYAYNGPMDWDLGVRGFTILVAAWFLTALAFSMAVTWVSSQILAGRTQRNA